MAKNKNLHIAKKNHIDEFFTRREDIENELSHYAEHFRGKVVYCNCDDPTWSEFWKFFVRVFVPWGLKKLIATHYETDAANFAYKLEIEPDANGAFDINKEPVKTPLPCNGDFRSAACIELLKEADIVVTNPPFSLARDYIKQLIEYDKKFLIIGPLNAIKYKDTFPFIAEKKMWVGYTHPKRFRVPEDAEGENIKVIDGVKYKIFGNVQWYTNLDIPKNHMLLDLRGNYYEPDKYPRYLNYDGINVDQINDIPCDYPGNMGVPITYLDIFNPDQFELLGISSAKGLLDTEEIGEKWIADYKAAGKTGHLTPKCHDLVGYDNGTPRAYYVRAIIKLRHPEERRYPDAD